MWGISWLAENRLASQEGLCAMEWVSKYSWSISPVLACVSKSRQRRSRGLLHAETFTKNHFYFLVIVVSPSIWQMCHAARGGLCLDVMITQWNRSAAFYVAMTCASISSLSKQCGRNVETLRQFLGSLSISLAGHLVRMSDDRIVRKYFCGNQME